MEEALQEIVAEIEEEKALNKVSGVEVFQSIANQPNLIAVSSADAIGQGSAEGFSSFSVNLPRPVLQADTLQLVNANVPLCVPNIPDTACGFWYYRLNAYSGYVPSVNNLFYVRLLPSYYKPEFISNASEYGFNRTFTGYSDVVGDLSKACMRDLGFTNWTKGGFITNLYKPQFAPFEIDITFNNILNKFEFVGQNAFRISPFAEWVHNEHYDVGDQVYFLTRGAERSFICIDANTNKQPDTHPTFWIENNQPIIQPWSATLTYGSNRVVVYNNVVYVAKQTTTNNIPVSSPTFWDVWDTSLPFTRYLLTGPSDPNVAIAQNTFYTPYDAYTLYEQDDAVLYNNAVYIALRQTMGVAPPSADWQITSIPISSMVGDGTTIRISCDNSSGRISVGDSVYVLNTNLSSFNSISSYNELDTIVYTITSASSTLLTASSTRAGFSTGGLVSLELPSIRGLRSFSEQFDMDLWNTGVPVGVPPQPFAPIPKRLLNSVLGFTWNGIMTPSVLSVVDATQGNEIPLVNVPLFNRLRPVPPYLVAQTTLELVSNTGDIPATTTQTYTAEGYANLVYTNIVSIYAEVVSGRSVNTSQNTNLLAIGSMNCGNLGVAFFQPSVLNELELDGADIYTLSFELRDEANEPLILTNNAIVSFVLRATYKNKVRLTK